MKAVISFKLQVLAPDDKWNAAIREGTFDPDQTATILHSALRSALRESTRRQESIEVLSSGALKDPFYTVIHDSYDCPFPFIFC